MTIPVITITQTKGGRIMNDKKLLTKEILNETPDLLDNDGLETHKVKVTAKFFDPTGSFTWYLTEIDKRDKNTCFGFVTSEFCPQGELGYFTISELESVKGHLGLGIERDKYFKATKLTEVMEGEE
tara:strand:+ start:380 stop:757 length:378 start_codon:yes stop_codon:yes gene_type:complete